MVFPVARGISSRVRETMAGADQMVSSRARLNDLENINPPRPGLKLQWAAILIREN